MSESGERTITVELNPVQVEVVRKALTICLDTDEYEEDFDARENEEGCEVIGLLSKGAERTVDPRRWTIRVCQHGHAERCGGIDCQEDKEAWRLVEVVEVLSKGVPAKVERTVDPIDLSEWERLEAIARAMANWSSDKPWSERHPKNRRNWLLVAEAVMSDHGAIAEPILAYARARKSGSSPEEASAILSKGVDRRGERDRIAEALKDCASTYWPQTFGGGWTPESHRDLDPDPFWIALADHALNALAPAPDGDVGGQDEDYGASPSGAARKGSDVGGGS